MKKWQFFLATIVILSLALSSCVLDNASTHLKSGNNFFALKEYTRAITEYNRALELDSRNVYVYINRALAYNQIGKYDLAIEDCTKAIELNPNSPLAYITRSSSYNEKGKYDLALADCNKAVSLDPGDPQAYINRAWAYNNKGNDEVGPLWPIADMRLLKSYATKMTPQR